MVFHGFKGCFGRVGAFTLFGLPVCVSSISLLSNEARYRRGQLLALGDNSKGLADPQSKEPFIKYPRPLSALQNHQIVDVSAGGKHAAAIDSNGDLFQWGEGVDVRCTLRGLRLSQVFCRGDSLLLFSETNQKLYWLKGKDVVPIKVNFSQRWRERISSLGMGEDHMVLLTNKGNVFTGGSNRFGQLGQGVTTETKRRNDYVLNAKMPSREHVERLLGGAPNLHNPSHEGQEEPIGEKVQQKIDNTLIFKEIKSDAKIAQVACGANHTLLRTEDGRVLAFGSNESLQLAMGPFDPDKMIVPTPVEITTLWPGGVKPTASRVSHVAAGPNTSYFVIEEAKSTKLMAAGLGLNGQLGNGSWTHLQGTPTKVPFLSDVSYFNETTGTVEIARCQYISAGDDHVAAVMKTRHTPGEDVYLWGANKFHQLGQGEKRANSAKPLCFQPQGVIFDQDAGSRIYCGPEVTFIY